MSEARASYPWSPGGNAVFISDLLPSNRGVSTVRSMSTTVFPWACSFSRRSMVAGTSSRPITSCTTGTIYTVRTQTQCVSKILNLGPINEATRTHTHTHTHPHTPPPYPHTHTRACTHTTQFVILKPGVWRMVASQYVCRYVCGGGGAELEKHKRPPQHGPRVKVHPKMTRRRRPAQEAQPRSAATKPHRTTRNGDGNKH